MPPSITDRPTPGTHEPTAATRPLMLRIPQAAALLAVSRSHLYAHVLAPNGPVRVVHIGGAVRVPMVELEAFVASRLTSVPL